MGIQFKTNKVLFKQDKISFCAAHCTCPIVIEPDPDDRGGKLCQECPSTRPCPHLVTDKKCTAKNLKLTFAGITYATSCFGCPDETPNTSVKVTAGALTGPYTLEQDAENNCIWVYESTTVPVTLQGYDNFVCGSPNSVATKLRIVVQRAFDHLHVTAALIFSDLNNAEFLLFSAISTTQTDLEKLFTLNGITGLGVHYCSQWKEMNGGQVGEGGTVTIEPCPLTPDGPVCVTCDHTKIPDCVQVVDLLTVPSTCTHCTPFVPSDTEPDTLQWDRTLPKNGAACDYLVTGVRLGDCINLKVRIQHKSVLDDQNVPLFGWYLELLKSDDTLMGRWYMCKQDDPRGEYVWDIRPLGTCLDLPAELHVVDCPPPHDCTDTTQWPDEIQVRVVDEVQQSNQSTYMSGEYTLTRLEGSDEFKLIIDAAAGHEMRVYCLADGWRAEVKLFSGGGAVHCVATHVAPKNPLGPYRGFYYLESTVDGCACCGTPHLFSGLTIEVLP